MSSTAPERSPDLTRDTGANVTPRADGQRAPAGGGNGQDVTQPMEPLRGAPRAAPRAPQPTTQLRPPGSDKRRAERIALAPGESVILGRGHGADISLADERLAAQHARFSRTQAGEFVITSLTGDDVYVNGLPVKEASLALGSQAQVGNVIYHRLGDELIAQGSTDGIQLDAVDVRETVRDGVLGYRTKVLLDDVSLSVPPGSFVVIVGGSGAGKTTLLNALSGQRKPQSGAVLYNGHDLYHHLAAYSHAQGYVPQDDIIHSRLSVQAALRYAARLRLPANYSRRQIRERVNETLEEIGMISQRHQLISSLSGGQRKRVSIGVELLARPGVFFLDEPTSGLDPALDRHIMQLLRTLANRGRTIILTTHTVDHLDLCDYVCFLAPGGRLAYFGPPAEMKRHFHMDDYADIYAAVREEPTRWQALFRQSPDYLTYIGGPRLQAENRALPEAQRHMPPPPAVRRLGAFRQFFLLTARYLEIFLHDPVNLLILLAQAPIIALLIALLSDHNVIHSVTANPQALQDYYAQRTLFIMVCSAVWFGIINAAREIVKERPIYLRERAIYLRALPYTLSKVVVLGAFALLQSAILLFIVGWKTGYPTKGIFLTGRDGATIEMLFTLWLVALAGLTLGLLVSALAPNSDRAVSIVPILLVPQIIFTDVIFTLNGATEVISWFMPSRWGLEAIGSITRLRDHYSDHLKHAFYFSSQSHVLGYWGALLGLAIAFLVLTLLTLRRDSPHDA